MHATGIKDGPGGLQDGGWDALHVVEGLPAADGRSATYKLTSSVLLSLAVRGEAAAVGELDVSGSVSRHVRGLTVNWLIDGLILTTLRPSGPGWLCVITVSV